MARLYIAEIEPSGTTNGTVVWAWHAWVHLVQDYDPTKANYGVVGDHPELIDLNYGRIDGADWLHINSIDYNADLEQIVLSVPQFDEIWVVDHSTTSSEAAGHTGGRYGRGGDLLYRWGNPRAYRAGTEADQKFYFQHDVHWIRPGLPGAGNLLVFNNGRDRPEGVFSTVEFDPDAEFMFTMVARTATEVTLQWASVPDVVYQVLHTTDLPDEHAAWSNVAEAVAMGTLTTLTDTDPARLGVDTGFYRVEQQID